MRFLFDCEDEICLPMAYRLVDEIKPFIDKVKTIDFEEGTEKKDRKTVLKKIMENVMVKYPKETGELLAKLWILEEKDEPVTDKNGKPVLDKDGNVVTKKVKDKVPNTFKTLAAFFSSEVAVDFFTSVLPSLLQISREVSPLLK